MARVFFNPRLRAGAAAPAMTREPMVFHRRLPEYAPTPLAEAPSLARSLNVSSVFVKDESLRLGLPSFKILGASWAAHQLICRRLGCEPEWGEIEELRAAFAPLRPLAFATATDGNHGRAVARVARLFGFEARIFVPAGTAAARIEGIEGEGARVTIVDGTYDDAVARAADEAGDRCLVVADTAWPGYEDVPRWVTEGYSTILHEMDDALAANGSAAPDVVVAQIGVGSLAAAVVRHFDGRSPRPRIIGVEPDGAACGFASAMAGRSVSVPGPHHSIMAGLNCGTLSTLAWPVLRDGIDCFVTVDNEHARRAVRNLAAEGLVSGETGAAGAAGITELLTGAAASEARERLRIDVRSSILLISTEGATDPAMYRAILEAAG